MSNPTPIPDDKLTHGLAGFAGQVLCESIAHKVLDAEPSLARSLGCLAIVNGLGAVKELTDKSRGGNPEWNDAAANAIGSSLAIPVIKFGF